MTKELDFGEPLGSLHGVTAYSNLDDSFFSGEKHYMWGIYTGYKYQCVEFARRYMLVTSGCQFGQCFRAAEIFHMTTVTNVETGDVLPFTQCKNGATTIKPQPGHILVYPHDQELMPVGHVAVVAEVGDDWVGIAEQNQDSFSWNGLSYGRRIPLKQGEDGIWTMVETDPELLQPDGWLFGDAPRRSDVHAPLKPLAEFLTVKEDCNFTRRRVFELNAEEKEARKSWRWSHIPVPESDVERNVEDLISQRDPLELARMQTILYPNETSGVGCIGTLNATFRCIAHGLQLIFEKDILASSRNGKGLEEWVAERYSLPIELASLLRDQMSICDLRACSVGSLSMHFTRSGPVVTSCNMDSLEHVYEAAILQGRICASNGHEEGWTPSITNDVKRFIEKFVRAHNKDEIIYFLDFGASSALPSGVFESDADRASYDVVRANAYVIVEFIKKTLPEAVRIVSIEDITSTESGALVLRDGGAPVRKIHRMCSWKNAFKLASLQASIADVVVTAQRAGLVSFYPPLFTHLTAGAHFLEDLHHAYSLQVTKGLDEAVLELNDYLPPLNPGSPHVFLLGEEGSKQEVAVQVRAVPVGGYWSSGMFLESRAGGPWTPACYRFIMHKREFTRAEVADE